MDNKSAPKVIDIKKRTDYFLSSGMLDAMMQIRPTKESTGLSAAEIDEIFDVIAGAAPAPASKGVISRRLSQVLSLPYQGTACVASGSGYAAALSDAKVSSHLRGNIPYCLSVAAVRSWFYYGESDIIFYYENIDFELVERLFFSVMVSVSDDTFKSIINDLRVRKTEAHDRLIIPCGISVSDPFIVGVRPFTEAWLTKFGMVRPGAKVFR